MRGFCVMLLLVLFSVTAEARPSPYPPADQFSGDRYVARTAQVPNAREVVQSVRERRVRASKKVRYLYRVKKQRPAPVPRERPFTAPAHIAGEYGAEPMSVWQGVKREATEAVRRVISFGRPAGAPRAWCGFWLGQHLGKPDRKLWLARNWAYEGAGLGGPAIGAVVVWPHHVGIITGKTASGWVVKSGNDGHAVRERVRSVSRAIAFRRV